MNAPPFNGSLTSLLDRWFFSFGPAFWVLLAAMLLIGLAAYLSRQLTASGAIAAVLIGFTVTWSLGFGALVSLLFFFISAGILSTLSKRLRRVNLEVIHAKGGQRDALQVLANGFFAFVAALLYYRHSSVLYVAMFGAAIAEAASDTFAGEVGVLSGSNPVSIITGRPMRPGQSGAVSPLGLASGLLGSALIALLIWSLLLPANMEGLKVASIIAASGFFGCLIDSVLGATVQAHYWDEQRKVITEKAVIDGRALPLDRGVRWMDNDMVNLLSNATAALVCLSLLALVL
ncbi:MAG TPA: DUF92 domain-containing protein [Sphaerochaeta sp.]|nr:DUF92 domain-containing protein [Sphaerochaeta sp.]